MRAMLLVLMMVAGVGLAGPSTSLAARKPGQQVFKPGKVGKDGCGFWKNQYGYGSSLSSRDDKGRIIYQKFFKASHKQPNTTRSLQILPADNLREMRTSWVAKGTQFFHAATMTSGRKS